MNTSSLTLLFTDPDQAKASIANAVGPFCRSHWADGGGALVVSIQPEEDARSVQQNKAYWGYVLKPISQQAQLGGMGAEAKGWHRYYKKMFLGYVFESIKVPGQKRPSVTRKLQSTRKLSERAMRKYCEEVRAHAASTFSVEFPAMPMDTTAPVKKLSRKRREVVDAETGEILEATP